MFARCVVMDNHSNMVTVWFQTTIDELNRVRACQPFANLSKDVGTSAGTRCEFISSKLKRYSRETSVNRDA